MTNVQHANINNDKIHFSAKPPLFDGDKFDYWNDRIKNFFLGFDVDICGMVIDGYTRPLNANSVKLERSVASDQQKKKKDKQNHHRSKTILLNVISYTEYEKITNGDYAKTIFDYLRMTHKKNEQVKETKALALI